MTVNHETDRRLAAFLHEGPADLSPQLAEAIRADIGRTRQRHGWRPGFSFPVSRFALVLAPVALLIIVAAAVVGGGAQLSKPLLVPSGPDASPTPARPSTVVGDGEAWYAYSTMNLVSVLIRADGTGDHQLIEDHDVGQGLPDWSPDGSRLVLERDYGPSSQLWLVDADGTNGRELTKRGDQCFGDCQYASEPAFSPDGRSIAFIRTVVDVSRVLSSQLVVLDLEAGTERVLLTSTATDAYHAPTWSPDGTRLAIELRRYASLGVSTTALPLSMSLALVDPGAATPAAEPIAGTESGGSPDWRPTGNELVFVRNPWIVRNPWDGGRLDRPRDLERLAPDAPTQIVVLSLDGGSAARVDVDGGDAVLLNPTWTPDGLAFTYARAETPTEDALIRERTDTGVDRPITDGAKVSGIGARLRPVP